MSALTLAPTFEAVITERLLDDEIAVKAIVHGVALDRPETHGFVVKNRVIAARLAKAIEAGAVFYDFEVKTDVYGKTYLGYRSHVMARYMNADLIRLGF